MKTKIAPSDIRLNDTVRVEFPPGSTNTAVEFIADSVGFNHAAFLSGSTYYLLDRPKPAVELPTEPTLGWLETKYAARILQVWFAQGRYAAASNNNRWNLETEVTAFTPATAIPTEALDTLRANAVLCSIPNVAKFLAAVDAANGPRA